MIDKDELKKIEEVVNEFFLKMTVTVSKIGVDFSSTESSKENSLNGDKKNSDVVELNVVLEEPQILIGEKGQTLFEIQRLLRAILNKRLSRLQSNRGSPTGVASHRTSTLSGQKIFYLNLDINDYKKKKTEYLKELARDLANEVALTKEEKVLFPMPAYERRIIHAELSQRQDVSTESQGEGQDRHIVIRPK